MRRVTAFLFSVTVVLMLSMQANAELYNRGTDSSGNQLIYDSDLNITWYDFTTSSGSWQTQMNWSAALTVNLGGTIYDDWRLPITYTQDCFGGDCTNNEMGHLYYTELGNFAAGPMNNVGDFHSLQNNKVYWLGTEYATDTSAAWYFYNDLGDLSIYNKDFHNEIFGYAIAVRDGDVAVAPEPISSILFVTGGTLLAGRRMVKRGRS